VNPPKKDIAHIIAIATFIAFGDLQFPASRRTPNIQNSRKRLSTEQQRVSYPHSNENGVNIWIQTHQRGCKIGWEWSWKHLCSRGESRRLIHYVCLSLNLLSIIVSICVKILRQTHHHAKMGPTEDVSNTALVNAHISKSNNALNTPPANTPPRAITPPPATEKRRMEKSTTIDSGVRSERSKTLEAAVDPNALSKALMSKFGDSGRSSDITPGGSPSRKRQRIYGDR
jgi:hypothetical protein